MNTDVAMKIDLAEQADILVNRTAHFVGEWIQERTAGALPDFPAHIAAEALANECIADAERLGIMPEEIKDEIGDLKEYLAETVLASEPSPTSPKD